MDNKEAAISFLKLAGTGKVKEAFDKFISENFIHHNQYFKADRFSLLKAMEDAHNSEPNKLVDVKHCYEDGNTIITHSLIVKEKIEIAVVHIFRFKNNKVIELWDLGQLIEKDSPNEKGLF